MPKSAKPTTDPAIAALTRKAGQKGGPARMAQLSAEERSLLASNGGKASARALSAKERSEKARKAVQARWAKLKKR